MSLRATGALLGMGLRYKLGVASVVEEQLARWARLAHQIPDPTLRSLALSKLREEGDNARSGAMLAGFAPRRTRPRTARAIVAAEVLFDYLDGRTEVGFADAQALAGRRALYRCFTGAVSGRPQVPPDAPERTYLLELSGCLAHELASLPSVGLVSERIAAAARRAAEAQARAHAVEQLGNEQLERWARQGTLESGLGWREHAAGCAASVLCVHALCTRAAQSLDEGPDPAALDRAYLGLAALAKLLDGLVDNEEEDPACARDRRRRRLLALWSQTRPLLDALGPRHDAIAYGLLAHYARTPAGAREPTAGILRELAGDRRASVAVARLLLASAQGRRDRPRAALDATIVASDEPAAG